VDKPDRWQDISRLYHAALDWDADQRAAFLHEACAGDEALRREVESLLAQGSDAKLFMSTPALDEIAQTIARSNRASLIGEQLGPYKLLASLGSGGMGEVYRARDTNLHREVALKILPEVFAADPDRLARFKREAQVLASLNHPNIGSIHGFEESSGVRALVLELVEGPTLADRVADGPLSLDEALPIARQIAEAIEAAHELGVVHRDLKPANIKLRPDGVVKVLDFGLAKALDSKSAPAAGASAAPAAMTSGASTLPGFILGTAPYMSPEQARGLVVDARADVWAFGCVLYEMLAGRVAFAGDTVSDTIAAILDREPDWTALPHATPPGIRRLLRRCLEKDSNRRVHAIADARIELDDVMTAAANWPRAIGNGGLRFAWILSIVLAGLIASVTTGLVVGRLKGRSNTRPPHTNRVLVDVAPADQLAGWPELHPTRTALAISPDGRHLVFSGVKGGQQQLYVRAMDQLEAIPILGTEGGHNPFFSPDGNWVGFWASQVKRGEPSALYGELKKVPLSGGPAVKLCIAPAIVGASWGTDDGIVFGDGAGYLSRVSAGGGTKQGLLRLSRGENRHGLPHVLPGGHAVLFTIQRDEGRWDNARVAVLSIATKELKVLLEGGADARYLPTGHLVYVHAGTLMAVSFDLKRLEVTGAPIAIVDGIMQAETRVAASSIERSLSVKLTDTGAAQFSVSQSGALVYVLGGVAPDGNSSLVWVDRHGAVAPIATPPGTYFAPRLSPDGGRLAVSNGKDRNVWIGDLSRGTWNPLTKDGGIWSAWSPDGKRVTFFAPAGSASPPGLFSLLTDGRSAAARLSTDDPWKAAGKAAEWSPGSWSPDGQLLASVKITPAKSGAEIWLQGRVGGERQWRPGFQNPISDRYPEFSPDGHWLAYTSNEFGSDQVYVQRYPGSGPAQQVTTEGGSQPAWARNGRELFYTVADRRGRNIVRMMAVDVTPGPTMTIGAPRMLFEGPFLVGTPLRNYDVTPDGTRFVMAQVIEPPVPPLTQIVVVENWFEELKRLVPPKP
jgi:serine/threonine-protein kinase